ncbi:MAG TPA: Hpt domain-containing protein [Bacteroidia bacterium]|jgi:HPt (histidine-containing phosphotransfer) domain-containing protein|nr:Hpt domain-containing protein [Bacteroidia bacterium]
MNDINDSAEKIIDLSYLIEVSKGNKTFVKEMITLFLSENPEEIRSLETGIRNKDYGLIKATAHKLRSTIPFIGLDKVIEKEVVQIETLAADKSGIEEIEKLFTKIKEACQKACVELMPV